MTLTPRDPTRIDRMIELLREAWHLVPDWRLTQLVINAADLQEVSGPLFVMEDDKMEQRLKATVGGLRRMIEARDSQPPPAHAE